MAGRFARLSAIIGAGVLVASVGCAPQSHEAPESPPAGWPEALSDFTVAWTAEPGIDLTTGPAVVVRAYVESYYLAYLTDDEKYLYPGFAQSVDANNPDGPDGTEELWPLRDGRPHAWVGTFRQHILRVEQSDQGATIYGCLYTYDSGVLVGDKFKAATEPGPYGGFSPFRIGLKVPGNNEPTAPQEGPLRAPFTNVFGGWRVANHQGGYVLTAEWPDRGREIEQCRAKAPAPPENRQFFPARTYKRSDFPVLPATPGWPADVGTATS
jgi:hypothetical protein